MSNTQETGGCEALPDPALLWPATMHLDDSGQVVLVEKGLIICRESIGQLDSSELVASELIESHKAGRYTLDEVALGLAEKTHVNDAERWLETILNAVSLGELALKNPENLADNLPYKPEKISEWSDQLSAIDIDQWLDSHPEYGITFRFHREWMQPAGTQPAEPDPTALRESIDSQKRAFVLGFEVTRLERRLAMEKMSYADERLLKSDIHEMRMELERLVKYSPDDSNKPPQAKPEPKQQRFITCPPEDSNEPPQAKPEPKQLSGRRDLQIQAILKVIAEMGFDPKRVPEGGKGEIESRCLENNKLFTRDAFKKAWQEARNRNLIEVEGIDKYRPNRSGP